MEMCSVTFRKDRRHSCSSSLFPVDSKKPFEFMQMKGLAQHPVRAVLSGLFL
jgi:hypothetical protein